MKSCHAGTRNTFGQHKALKIMCKSDSMSKTWSLVWHIHIHSPTHFVLERLPFLWSTFFFLEEKNRILSADSWWYGVLRCLRSTGLFLILTGLALLKRPPSVSSLPRADPLHLVQSWRPLSPLETTIAIPMPYSWHCYLFGQLWTALAGWQVPQSGEGKPTLSGCPSLTRILLSLM